jgi:LacI family transcriptional regulator
MLQRVTLRDVAAAAGVHYSTVSLALRDHPRISESITRKVKETAERMGYQPDPALSALNAYRKTKLQAHYQSTLAWIDNWTDEVRLRDQPTFNEYFLGASERARQLGYEVEEFRMQKDGIRPEQLSRILRNRGIKGLLLAPQPTAGMQLPLAYEWFSAITFGYSLKPRIFHLVTNHQPHSADLAFAHLKDLGYKRIGLLMHADHDEKVENAYLNGHWRFHHHNPGETRIEPCLVPQGKSIKTCLFRWFRKTRPDAIVAVGGFDFVGWLGELGVRVPGDVGLANLSVAENEPHLSGVHENGRIIGRTAVDFLVGMLQRGETGPPETPIRILVEGVWKPGQTVRQQIAPVRRTTGKNRPRSTV